MLNPRGGPKPSLSGIPYTEVDIALFPTTPVLDIILLNFQADVNVLDASRPEATLWHRSLQFTSSLPGCQSIRWALLEQKEPQAILVLIQWESGQAWKQFQNSLGFTLLLGYIKSSINRSLQLELPSEALGAEGPVELVSYYIPATASIKEHDFQREVYAKSASDSEIVSACGGWLDQEFETENRYFAGLLFWKPGIDAERTQQDTPSKTTAFGHEAEDVVSVLTKPVNIASKDSLHAVTPIPNSLSSTQCNHPLLNGSVTPCYRAEDSFEPGDLDRLHAENYNKQQAGKLLSAGPTGQWYSTGAINQHEMPALTLPNSRGAIEAISTCLPLGDGAVVKKFKDLLVDLWKPADCSDLRWGKSQDDTGDNRICVFLEYKDGGGLSEDVRLKFQSQLEALASESHVNPDLSYLQIPKSRPLGAPPTLEIMTFHVPSGESNRRAFEYAFQNFLVTTMPQLLKGFGSTDSPPCSRLACGWGSSPEIAGDPPVSTDTFVAAFGWSSSAVRSEWYGIYAEQAKSHYQRQGHVVDWLRSLAVRAQAQFFSLEKKDDALVDLERQKQGLGPLRSGSGLNLFQG